MKKIFLIIFLLFFITSCFNKEKYIPKNNSWENKKIETNSWKTEILNNNSWSLENFEKNETWSWKNVYFKKSENNLLDKNEEKNKENEKTISENLEIIFENIKNYKNPTFNKYSSKNIDKSEIIKNSFILWKENIEEWEKFFDFENSKYLIWKIDFEKLKKIKENFSNIEFAKLIHIKFLWKYCHFLIYKDETKTDCPWFINKKIPKLLEIEKEKISSEKIKNEVFIEALNYFKEKLNDTEENKEIIISKLKEIIYTEYPDEKETIWSEILKIIQKNNNSSEEKINFKKLLKNIMNI